METLGLAFLSVTPWPTMLTGAPCPILLDPASVYPSCSISTISFVWGLFARALSLGCSSPWE